MKMIMMTVLLFVAGSMYLTCLIAVAVDVGIRNFFKHIGDKKIDKISE